MAQNTNSELVKLIRNEIDLGFTFMETHRLSSSREHSVQAEENAKTALETAKRFLNDLSEEQANAFRPDLERLEGLIDSAAALG
ncbi:MAG: hypothetical protein ACJ74Y_15555 [Bryobacteraceae bacterium]